MLFSAAARISEVPAGTVTWTPSMLKVIISVATLISFAGVPKSRVRMVSIIVFSWAAAQAASSSPATWPKSCGKWFSADSTG